jgi:hypothetical protein
MPRKKNNPRFDINDIKVKSVFEKQSFIKNLVNGKNTISYKGIIITDIDKKNYQRMIELSNNPNVKYFRLVPVYKNNKIVDNK